MSKAYELLNLIEAQKTFRTGAEMGDEVARAIGNAPGIESAETVDISKEGTSSSGKPIWWAHIYVYPEADVNNNVQYTKTGRLEKGYSFKDSIPNLKKSITKAVLGLGVEIQSINLPARKREALDNLSTEKPNSYYLTNVIRVEVEGFTEE